MNPTSNYTPGIDVSHYQGKIDWPRVKVAGIQFAYLKATDGTAWVDPMFDQNAEGCNLAGIPFGAYHFFRPDQDAVAQADHFWTIVGNLPLPPALDLEVGPVTNSQVISFAGQLDKQASVVNIDRPPFPLIYCSPAFAKEWLSGLSAFPLWLAEYGDAPDTTQWDNWEFWQHTPNGQVDGISTAVDLDWFHGTLEDMKVRFSLG